MPPKLPVWALLKHPAPARRTIRRPSSGRMRRCMRDARENHARNNYSMYFVDTSSFCFFSLSSSSRRRAFSSAMARSVSFLESKSVMSDLRTWITPHAIAARMVHPRFSPNTADNCSYITETFNRRQTFACSCHKRLGRKGGENRGVAWRCDDCKCNDRLNLAKDTASRKFAFHNRLPLVRVLRKSIQHAIHDDEKLGSHGHGRSAIIRVGKSYDCIAVPIAVSADHTSTKMRGCGSATLTESKTDLADCSFLRTA